VSKKETKIMPSEAQEANRDCDVEYVPINIQKFRNCIREIPIDVYLKLPNNNFAHVFSKETGIDYERLAQYVLKGVRQLYVKGDERAQLDRYFLKTNQEIIKDDKVPQELKIKTLYNMTEQNLSELFQSLKIQEDTSQGTVRIVNNLVDFLTKSPKSLSILMKLASSGENYHYYHAVSSAVLSLFLAKASGQCSQKNLETIGLGAFLHDIGMAQIPDEIINSPNLLTEEEWQIVREHPRVGMSMLDTVSNVPDEVKYIVYQHHEEPRGNGYPNGLSGSVIYHPAKIVSLGESFASLITARPYRPAYTLSEAIEILKSEKGKYDRKLLETLEILIEMIKLKKIS